MYFCILGFLSPKAPDVRRKSAAYLQRNLEIGLLKDGTGRDRNVRSFEQ